MSAYPTCEECGCPAAPRLTGRGAVSMHHEPGGKLCRLKRWEREADERGLVRVVGETLTNLSQRVDIVYGLYDLTLAEAQQKANEAGWSKIQQKPGVVTAAFMPRWAVVIERAFQGFWSEAKLRAFDRARRDEEWRDAMLSVADLTESEDALRRAVVAFCNGGKP